MLVRSLIRSCLALHLLLVIVTTGCRQQSSSQPIDVDVAKSTTQSTAESDADRSVAVVALKPGEFQTTPLATRGSSDAPLFERLTAEVTGVDFANKIDPDHPMSRLYHSGFVCGGVVLGDVDGDGRSDLFLVSGADDNRLYRQRGDFQFEDITTAAGVGGDGRWGAGASMLDIDNDDDLDIYVCNYDGPNQLFVNDGRGNFVDKAEQFGLDISDASLMPAFCDYDRDGDLDLYLLTNRYYRKGGRPRNPPFRMENGKPVVLPEFQKFYALKRISGNKFGIDSYGRDDLVLRNDGNGKFTNVTQQSGISGHGFGLSATWWDYNSDGWPDIYVCNDFDDPDRLYRNNHDGTFTDVLVDAMPHTTWFSMGSDAGDLNNDGLFDFFAVDMSATNHFKQKTTMGAMNAAKLAAVAGPPPQLMRNALFINSGTGRFWESAYLSGIADSDWSWSPKFGDFDNDGWLDIFISNGMVRNFNDSDIPFNESMLIGQDEWDIYKKAPPRPEQNLAFRNQGELRFDDVSKAWGVDHVGISYGTALGDLDRDGDLDMVIVNVDEPISIYRNQSHAGNAITVSLRGSASNRQGWGAVVELASESGTQTRHLHPTTGFLSGNEPRVHFGIGSAAAVETLTIKWPSGATQVLEKIPANHHVSVCEPEMEANIATSHPEESTERPMFVSSASLAQSIVKEKPFDDFARQPLLPNQLSQLGPGMACGDVDADGDDDIYVGGPAGQAGQLWIADGKGGFAPSKNDFASWAACEDMGALLFDCDNDDDLDLYVVSGGVECEPEADELVDRLYLNDGAGVFEFAAGRLPDLRDSGGPVSAADFDRDGDIDLFVGGRSIPGQYPLSPKSRLLRNDGGTFVDVTADLAASLLEAGLVSAAVWTDVDNDGWCDLALAVEWGPLRILRNQHGQLQEMTDAAGLNDLTGWWNGIAARDLDSDGDIDLVATNFGLNTKYHASAEHPALLYYGDFEKNGKMQLVEAEFENEKLFPIRGKSCSTRAMPSLAKQFPTYQKFALAELDELYTEQCLQESHRFAATTLESGVFMNDGAGKFAYRPLPMLAQISPGYGLIVSEFTGDQFPDIYMVHNFFTPQPETGRMDSGMSLLMAGAADGKFTPIGPRESGLVVTGDGKSVLTTDINQDGLADLTIGINNGTPQTYIRAAADVARFVNVRLRDTGHQTRSPIGARVTVHSSNGTRQTDEVRCGGGYMSQSSNVLTFGVPEGTSISTVDVVWPDGVTTTHQMQENQRTIEIQRTSDGKTAAN